MLEEQDIQGPFEEEIRDSYTRNQETIVYS